ncbi:MAG: CDP-diacylglycerol--serine O-phosphatidyltransferase [Acidobacteria bacterium]|nr:CDP-diacylglycerol--serine O-phosphatidyltransferase [Acidobacteriota bacterium]MBI3657118.1 CDP-diacylglycerol--serine O-phosphatidyltransferase [Acidobacteriota bacterium]
MKTPDDPATREAAPKRLRRRILILPTSFTVGNIFFGFYSIICALRGEYDIAAKLIGLSWLCDALDGKIARMAHATSDFGLQLDSIADVIGFGVAPALLLMMWGLQPLDRGGIFWGAAFIYLICGAMRLARFNISAQNLRHFVGMPIPAAGTLIAALVYLFPERVNRPGASWALVALACGLGALMISTIRYPSLKFVGLTKGKSHFNVFLLALLIVTIYMFSQYVLFAITVVYAASGLIMKLYALSRRKRGQEPLPLHAPDAASERH